MSEFPLDPMLSKMLITASSQFQCSNEILSIVSLMSVPQIFLRPRNDQAAADSAKRQFIHHDGDHITMLNAFNAFIAKKMDPNWCWDNYLSARALKQANDVRNQLVGMAQRQGLSLASMPFESPDFFTNIKKCLLSGFFMQTAHLERNGHYLTLKDEQVVMIHPSTALDSKPQWVLYNEFVLTSKNFIRTVTAI